MKILFIDDNRLLVSSVQNLLEDKYVVDYSCTGQEGIEKACAVHYSVILLDLGLPDMNGLEVCKRLRASNVTSPILVVTVEASPLVCADLLDNGADDYVTKPFSGRVLKARISALLRRGQDMREETIIKTNDLTVNITRRSVHRAGVHILLRKKEFDILEYLMVNKGHALSRTMILDYAWEAGTESWNNTVDVHIKRLRDKIDKPFSKPLIKTAYGIGYMVDDEP